MRVDIHTEEFELTPQLRHHVESTVLEEVGGCADRLKGIMVRLRANTGRNQPDTGLCSIVVSLDPSGEVHARAEDPRMDVAIARASKEVRLAVDRAVFESRPAADLLRGEGAGRHDDGVLEIVLDDNRISHQLREWLERPENYLRPIRVRERWKVSGLDEAAVPEEAETARAK